MKKAISIILLLLNILSATAQESNNYIIKGDVNTLPFNRIDTLKLYLYSKDSTVENMLSRYVKLERNLSNANTVLFTKVNDFSNYRGFDGKKTILINSENKSIKRISPAPNVEIVIRKDVSNSKAIQKIFGASTGIEATGDNRLGFGKAESVGIDYNKLSYKIDSIVGTSIVNGVAPGIQVLVARNGLVVFHKSYGYHTYDSIHKVGNDNIYDWASLTKITSALPALMKLHDENKFDLDKPLGTYIPYFERGNKKDIIYRRMLSHNAGLKSWIPFWKTTIRRNGKYRRRTLSNEKSKHYNVEISPDLYIHDRYKEKIYRQIKKSEVNKEEQPKYKYSGLLFYLLPEVVENISGYDYQEYLDYNFYKKLGANTVGYNPLNDFAKELIIPTEVDTLFRHVQIHGNVHDEGAAMMGGVSANAGLFGTTLDLAKIMQMYLWNGRYGGEQYISENTIKKFTCANYANEGNRRGLGFDKPSLGDRSNDSSSKDASMSSFGHSGYTGTFAWADPDTGILYIFMSNRVYPTRDNGKIYKYNVRPSIHQAIYDAIIPSE